MNKICTDIPQSKRFVELGIDVSTADMWWAERYKGHVMENGQYIVDDTPYYYLSLTRPSDNNWSQDTIKDIPTWSLAALLELTPNDVSLLHFENAYQAVYDVKPYHITEKFSNPIDAAYKMVI